MGAFSSRSGAGGVTVALLAVSACTVREAARSGVTRTDSAGIEIVQNLTPAWTEGEAWTLASQPRLTIGQTEGDLPYIFSRIAGAVRLEDGRIVVGDGQSNQIRFFDPNGGFLSHVGRKGKGPGEYEYLRYVDRCAGDSITAFDLQWQPKLYDQQGNLGRETTLFAPGTHLTPYNLSCSRSGKFLVTGWGDDESPLGFYRTTAPLSLLDRDGNLEVALGIYPSSERLGYEHGSRPHPFGKTTVLAVGEDALYIGTADEFEIQVFDLTGTLVRLIRGPKEDRSITRPYLDAYLKTRLDGVAADRRPAVEREVRDMPKPKTFPAYADLRLDDAGFLWVENFRRPGAADALWTVFDPSGRLLGTVTFPLGLHITEIGGDYILGVVHDDLGVERVRLYDLIKP